MNCFSMVQLVSSGTCSCNNTLYFSHALTQICGDDAPAWKDEPTAWRACRGSNPTSRGFTCGLWMLFHGSAARYECVIMRWLGWLESMHGNFEISGRSSAKQMCEPEIKFVQAR